MSQVDLALLQEDLVYQQPDDDSPSQILWMASKNWLTLDRLLAVQSRVIQEVEDGVNEVLKHIPPKYCKVQELEKGKGVGYAGSLNSQSNEDSSSAVIDYYQTFSCQESLKTLMRCSNLAKDDLIKPTAHLLDMVRQLL